MGKWLQGKREANLTDEGDWDQRSNTAINAEKAAFAAFLSTVEEDPLVYRHADFQNSNRYQLHRYANFAR